MNETIDFKDYIFGGETWLNVKGLNGVEPEMDIKITRYLKNRFIKITPRGMGFNDTNRLHQRIYCHN